MHTPQPMQGLACSPTKAESANPPTKAEPASPPYRDRVHKLPQLRWSLASFLTGGACSPTKAESASPRPRPGLASLRPEKSFRAIFARKAQLLDILPESHPQKTSSPRNANRKSPGHEVFTVRHCRNREIRPANKPTFFANSAKNFARLDEKASPPQREEPLPPQRKTLFTLAREPCPPGEEDSFSPGENLALSLPRRTPPAPTEKLIRPGERDAWPPLLRYGGPHRACS